MKKMEIYEPAMCCETGLCGVGIDPELLRISTVLNTLKKAGYDVGRFNLNSAPMAFVENTVINKFINEKGVDELPATLLENEIIMTGRYPTNEEFINLLELPEGILADLADEKKQESCCCNESENCR